MTKLFTPTKLFFFFCGGLIVVWTILQLVINLRLTTMAKVDGQRVLDWSWPSLGMRARSQVLSAEVVNRTATDAVVRVKARQTLERCDSPGSGFRDSGEASDCQAVFTYYKANRNWFLGKVEMQ
jgi:hypothetical protein